MKNYDNISDDQIIKEFKNQILGLKKSIVDLQNSYITLMSELSLKIQE